jgi:hypothetical protein
MAAFSATGVGVLSGAVLAAKNTLLTKALQCDFPFTYSNQTHKPQP